MQRNATIGIVGVMTRNQIQNTANGMYSPISGSTSVSLDDSRVTAIFLVPLVAWLLGLIGFLGSFELAEEAAQEAFAVAAQRADGERSHRGVGLQRGCGELAADAFATFSEDQILSAAPAPTSSSAAASVSAVP